MQIFLGLYNYYGCFVHHFADLAAPFYNLLQQEATWHWTDTEEFAMHSLLTVLYKHPILALQGFTKPFQIERDASNTRGIFTQDHAFFIKPLLFYTRP